MIIQDQEKILGFKLLYEINSDKNNFNSIDFYAETYSNLSIQANKKNDLFKKSFSNNFTVEKKRK